MIDIGLVSGKIWGILNTNKHLSVSAMIKESGEKKDAVLMAIGWLMREDKLIRQKKGMSVLYSLK